jgi:hypothetical protein
MSRYLLIYYKLSFIVRIGMMMSTVKMTGGDGMVEAELEMGAELIILLIILLTPTIESCLKPQDNYQCLPAAIKWMVAK